MKKINKYITHRFILLYFDPLNYTIYETSFAVLYKCKKLENRNLKATRINIQRLAREMEIFSKYLLPFHSDSLASFFILLYFSFVI